MPYKSSSSIPHKMFYSAVFAEILQICKATTKFQDFIKSAKVLIGRIMKQGGLINHVKKALLILFSSHKECFSKFGKINYYFLNKLLKVRKF